MNYYRINVTVLVPAELQDTLDPDQESIFIASREQGIIVLRPINSPIENHYDASTNDYKAGYMMGENDGYLKGYAYAKAVDRIKKLFEEDEDELPDCTGFCRACPHYDDLFDTCKYYSE